MPRQFGAFTASELYCPKCRTAQPVRERLLLILPDGELYEFLCAHCATSLAKRTVSGPTVATPAESSRRAPNKAHRLH
jgi:hypothetical protein